MECPYCTAEINDQALACAHCGRDVSFLVIRSLASRLDALARHVAEMDEELHHLRAVRDSVEAHHANTHANAHAAVRIGAAVSWLLLSVLLLLLAHGVLVGLLDLDPRILRFVSILIPLPFGFRHLHSLPTTLWAGLLVAGASVFGMLMITSMIDHVPFLPEKTNEWVEVGQYFASIALAYYAGSLIGWRARTKRQPSKASRTMIGKLAALLAGSLAQPKESRANLQQRITSIAGWINAIVTAITALGAVIAAVSKFYG